MCMGGGGKDQYDAYKKGDYQQWERLDDRAYRIESALENPNLSDARKADLTSRLERVGGRADRLAKKVEDDPAARLDIREHNRQQDITTGRRVIDTNFEQFDKGYYDEYGQKYVDFYTPQLDDQYANAKGKLISALVNRGTLESTAGIGKQADLLKERDTAAQTFANEAQDAQNKLQANVEKTKSDLYSLNEASADPQSINARAQGEATALVAPPAFNPIGQVFASFLSGLGNIGGGGGVKYTPYSSPVGGYPTAGSGQVYG